MSAAGRGARTSALPKAGALLISLAALAMLGLVSLTGASLQAQATDEGAIVLGIAGVIAAAALASRPSALVPRSRLGIAWAAFLAWALLAVAVSGRVWGALAGEVTNLLGWFTLAAFTLVVVVVSTRGSAALRVLETIAPIVVFGQVAATLVQLSVESLRYNPRGSLPNSTYLGEALLLLLPFTLAEDSGWIQLSRTARYALAVTTIVVLAASGSRVAAVVAIAWFVWVLLRRSSLPVRMKALATVGLLLLVAVGGFAFARAEILGSTGVQTLGVRPQMWRAAALAVEKRPVVGYGPDGFVAGGASVTTPALARTSPVIVFHRGAVDPHSLPVWVAVSTGVVGLVLFVWAFVELAIAWRVRARTGADVAPGVWAVVGVVVVFCTAPVALQVVPLLAFVLGASLAAASAVGGDVSNGARAPFRRVAGWALVAVLCVASLVFVANSATRLVLENHGPDISPKRAAFSQVAMDLWPWDAHLAYLASQHWGWVAAADPAVAARQPDLLAIERAVKLDSRDPLIALEYARTLDFYGAPDARVDAAFAEAFRRWPLHPVARAEYATFLARRGRIAEAEKQVALAALAENADGDVRSAVATARAAIAEAGK